MKYNKNKTYYSVINHNGSGDEVTRVTFLEERKRGYLSLRSFRAMEESNNVFVYQKNGINHEIILEDDDVFLEASTARTQMELDSLKEVMRERHAHYSEKFMLLEDNISNKVRYLKSSRNMWRVITIFFILGFIIGIVL